MEDSHDIHRSYIFIYLINHYIGHTRNLCFPIFLFSQHIVGTRWELPWVFFQTGIDLIDSRKEPGCGLPVL